MNTHTAGTTILGRSDWNGNFDSIKWALEVHAKITDTGTFNCAVLYGNEDCPERIDFYKSANPNWNEYVAFTWRAGEDWEHGGSYDASK